MAKLKIKKIIKRAVPTIRQKRVIQILNSEKLRSKGEVLRKAGYSESVSKAPSQVFEKPAVKEAVFDILEALDHEIKETVKLMEQKRSKANFANLSISLNMRLKEKELLSGRATDRVETVDEETKEKITRLLNKNK